MKLTKEQAIELLKKIIRGDLRHKDYKRVCKIASTYEKYITGEDVEDLLIRFVKRETPEAFKQRCDLTSLTTPDIANTLANPMYKIGRTIPNETMTWSSTEKSEEKRKELSDVCKNFFGDMSLDNYLTQRMVELDCMDPNSFIVTEFSGSFDPKKPVGEMNQKVRPYPFEVNSEEAIHYKFVNNELQYLVVYLEELVKYTIYIENDSIVAREISKEDYKALTPEEKAKLKIFYKDEKDTESSPMYVLEEFSHKAGRIPARRVGTVTDPKTRNRTCVPMIHKAETYFKKAIKTVSEFDLTNAVHVFPKVFRYDEPCVGDMVKGLICNNGKDADGSACSICKGTGYKPQTSTVDEVIIKMPRDMKDVVNLDNMMTYKAPPADLIKFQKEYGLYDLKELAIKAVYNGDTFIKDSVVQTATEASINLESVYDTLKPFADSWSAMKKHTMLCIAAYRDLNKDFVYDHSFNKDFKMKSLTALLDDLKKANDSGTPSYVKKSIIHDINKKIYIDSPSELLKLQVKERFFPFNGKSESEINYILANGLATRYDRILYSKFDSFFDELADDQAASSVDYYKMEPLKQKELLKKKVEDYIILLDEEESNAAASAFNSASKEFAGGGV